MTMIHSHIINSHAVWRNKPLWNKNNIINGLIQSRNIFDVQTLDYDLAAVCSTDIDPTGNFLLVGLSNGSVDLQGVQDPTFGTLDQISRLNLSPFNIHRVQWNPGDEQFFSMLDNHNLHLVDPNTMRCIDRFAFNLKSNWSEWNPNDRKMIAVCGSESQARLVDIRSGSSVQCIILSAMSRLPSHRATRCLWSRQDLNCLIVGDNEGYIHIYDTRQSSKPLLVSGEEFGQISGMSFTTDNNSIITSQGSENRLVQWVYDKCTLQSLPTKFKKRKPPLKTEDQVDLIEDHQNSSVSSKEATRSKKRGLINKTEKKKSKKIIPLPADAYIRCQFYVSDRHIFCPVPARVKKSKEIYIYDIANGDRIKTLKSNDVLCQGVYSVIGLLPESLALYVGGRGRLRLWTLDEDHQRKLEEKIKSYHKSRWDSDDETVV